MISVVTPSFNQARFLEQTMESVLTQDYPYLEYIIVDGASSDGSQEIIKKHEARLAWWVSERDAGQTDALNKGFSRAKGRIFAWLNADDIWHPGAARRAVEHLMSDEGCGLVYGDADYIDEAGQVIGRFPAAQTDLPRLRRGYVHIPQQAAFFRARLWHAVGPLDPSYYFAMDYDLWVRIAARSRIKYVPQVWAGFRLHSDAKTIAADDRCWPEMVRVHYRDGGSWFSILVAKHYLRKVVGPLLRWRRRRLLSSGK